MACHLSVEETQSKGSKRPKPVSFLARHLGHLTSAEALW